MSRLRECLNTCSVSVSRLLEWSQHLQCLNTCSVSECLNFAVSQSVSTPAVSQQHCSVETLQCLNNTAVSQHLQCLNTAVSQSVSTLQCLRVSQHCSVSVSQSVPTLQCPNTAVSQHCSVSTLTLTQVCLQDWLQQDPHVRDPLQRATERPHQIKFC